MRSSELASRPTSASVTLTAFAFAGGGATVLLPPARGAAEPCGAIVAALPEPGATADPDPLVGLVVGAGLPEQAAIARIVNALPSLIRTDISTTQPAARPGEGLLMSRPLVSPIDRYVDATFQRFQDVLAAAALIEPVAEDPALGLRRLNFLVETLTAFAIGHAVWRVGELLRRGTAPEVRNAIEAELGRLSQTKRDDTATRFAAPPRTTRRPLADELRQQLHGRLWLAATQARALLKAIDRVVAEIAPERAAALTTTLSVLAEDVTGGYAFEDQLALGWRYFVAILDNRPDPQVADDPRWRRGRALWAAWSRRVRGDQPAPARDFIVRVA